MTTMDEVKIHKYFGGTTTKVGNTKHVIYITKVDIFVLTYLL